MSLGSERPQRGWVAEELAAELPGLELHELTVAAAPDASSEGVREHLRHLSRRMTGAEAVAQRTRPVPHAYRVLFRQLGLDPDRQRPPSEAVVLDRLMHGEHRSANRIDDALTVAVAETGVPLWAVDDERIDGPLGLRPATAGEPLPAGEHAHELPAGRLVVADAAGVVGVLFGRFAADRLVSRATSRVRLFCVRAPGVPMIHVEEAFALALDCLAAG